MKFILVVAHFTMFQGSDLNVQINTVRDLELGTCTALKEVLREALTTPTTRIRALDCIPQRREYGD